MIPYSAQIRHVELIERNKTQVQLFKVYRSNAQIVPTAAKYTLQKPNGDKIIDKNTASINVSGNITYALNATEIPETLSLGEGYVEEFHVTIDGVEYIFRRMASLCLRKLYPVISDADLVQIHTDLEALRPSTLTSYQTYIDDAFYQILRKIRSQGMGYEYLVMSPESLYDVNRSLALYLIFKDFHSSISAEGRFLELAQDYYKIYLEEFNSINWLYDQSHEKKPTDANRRKAGRPVIYTTAPSYYGYKRRRR